MFPSLSLCTLFFLCFLSFLILHHQIPNNEPGIGRIVLGRQGKKRRWDRKTGSSSASLVAKSHTLVFLFNHMYIIFIKLYNNSVWYLLFFCLQKGNQGSEVMRFSQSLKITKASAGIVNSGFARAWRTSFLCDWLRTGPRPVKTGWANGNIHILSSKMGVLA